MSISELKPRIEMNPEFTWQLEDMVSGSDEWNLLYDSIEKQIGSITEYAGKIMSSSQNLFNCLDEKINYTSI